MIYNLRYLSISYYLTLLNDPIIIAIVETITTKNTHLAIPNVTLSILKIKLNTNINMLFNVPITTYKYGLNYNNHSR